VTGSIAPSGSVRDRHSQVGQLHVGRAVRVGVELLVSVVEGRPQPAELGLL